MRCHECGRIARVVESRENPETKEVWRIRECTQEHRFTTVETVTDRKFPPKLRNPSRYRPK